MQIRHLRHWETCCIMQGAGLWLVCALPTRCQLTRAHPMHGVAGGEVEAMRAVAKAHQDRSLAAFQVTGSYWRSKACVISCAVHTAVGTDRVLHSCAGQG